MFNSINLYVNEGEFFVIMGLFGCGKLILFFILGMLDLLLVGSFEFLG